MKLYLSRSLSSFVIAKDIRRNGIVVLPWDGISRLTLLRQGPLAPVACWWWWDWVCPMAALEAKRSIPAAPKAPSASGPPPALVPASP
jgi:hypothetical protein